MPRGEASTRADQCPLSRVKRTWLLRRECLLLTQSGHRLPLPYAQPKPVSYCFLSLGDGNEAARVYSACRRLADLAARCLRPANRTNAAIGYFDAVRRDRPRDTEMADSICGSTTTIRLDRRAQYSNRHLLGDPRRCSY